MCDPLNPFHHLEMLNNPPKPLFYHPECLFIEQLLFFIFCEYNIQNNYSDWVTDLFHITPVKFNQRLYKAAWSETKMLAYICLKLRLKVILLTQTSVLKLCPENVCTRRVGHHSKSCYVMTCYYNSYLSQLYNYPTKEHVFVLKASTKSKNWLYLLKETPSFPVFYTTLPTQSLAVVEQDISSTHRLPNFKLLQNLNQDPLKHHETSITVYAVDHLLTETSSLHCIAQWGDDNSSSNTSLVLVYAYPDGWVCHFTNTKTKSPPAIKELQQLPVWRDTIRLAAPKKKVFQEESCCCQSLPDFYISSAKHKLFKPVGSEEPRDLVTLLNVIGLLTPSMEVLLSTISQVSLLTFDVESLCHTESYIPIPPLGIAKLNDNTYFTGRHILQSQQPFLIGITHLDLKTAFQQCFPSQLQRHLTHFLKGKKNLAWMLQCMSKYTQECALLKNVVLTTHKTKVFHIHNNIKKDQVTEPSSSNIDSMVQDWLYHIYQYAKLALLFKHILLEDLITLLSNVSNNIVHLSERKYSDMFAKAIQKSHAIEGEVFVVGFNSANYDLPVLSSHLWNVCLDIGCKPTFYKNATSIASLNIKINQWKKEQKCPMRITFKDARNLQEPNVSLAVLGQKYGLETQKGLFPHSLSVSVSKLKTTKHLPPPESLAWFNILSNDRPSVEDIHQAHQDCRNSAATNLYQYAVSYLIKDCEVLFHIFLKMMTSWQSLGIFLFLHRKFTISSAVFYHFYIKNMRIKPYIQVPGKITDPLCNLICSSAVTGGYTSCHTKNRADQTFVINSHLNQHTFTPSPAFPNFLPGMKFDLTLNSVHGYDIRSQYAFSSTQPLPGGPPVLISTINVKEIPKKPVIDLSSYCAAVQQNPTKLFVQKVNGLDYQYKEEYYAIQNFLKFEVVGKLDGYSIDFIASASTSGGQINIGPFFVDALVKLSKGSLQKIQILQYQGRMHGCKIGCPVKNFTSPDNVQYRLASDLKHEQLLALIDIWKQNVPNLQVILTLDYPCNYHHTRMGNSLLADIVPKLQPYAKFMEKIYDGSYKGFLTVKNLQLKQTNPCFGFCIQKSVITHDMYSPYMKKHYKLQKKPTVSVLGLHTFKGIKNIHTDYLLYLKNTFEFKEEPLILHAVLFHHEPFLKEDIDSHLIRRGEIKELLKNPQLSSNDKMVLESKSTELKLR